MRFLKNIELGIHINFTFPMESGISFSKTLKILVACPHFQVSFFNANVS